MKQLGILYPKNLFSLAFAILSVAVIAYLNFALIRFHFLGEFNQNVASIEISYIQMARFWKEFGFGGWQPLWYLGYPWHVFYTPLLPFLEVLLNTLFNFSFAHAYRLLTGAGYVLAPVSLYFFVWQLAKSKTGAFVAALMYSLAPSVISVIFKEVGADVISNFIEPRRFTILVRWGEGPHTLALVFLPLFGFFLVRFLQKSKFVDLVAASFFLGLAALTNAIVIWVAILLLAAFFLSETAQESAQYIKVIKRVLAVVILGFGLVAFWYNLPFMQTFFKEGGGAINNWVSLFPWVLIPLGLVGFLIVYAVNKLTGSFKGVGFSIFWFFSLFAIVFIYYASGEDRIEYVPQALRLNTEVDMALSVLAGVVISNLFLWFWDKKGMITIVTRTLALLVVVLPSLVLLVWGSKLLAELPEHTRPLTQSKIGDISEYKVATKLAELTEGTGERVLAPGNYGFWLNYFKDVPQLRGALYQSSTHSWPEHIYYQVTNGTDSNISLAWLKIANIGKLVYTTIGSAETYKDYKVPAEKLKAIGTEILTENGDIYFDIPLKNDSLAKVVDFDTSKGIAKPYNAIDEKPIFEYLDWIEKKSDKKLRLTKISNSRYKIEGELREGEAVLFQQTYDPGWKVKPLRQDSGQVSGWKVVKDPLDFALLVPKKSGRFEIELAYRKPWSVWLGYLVTAGALAWVGYTTYKLMKKDKTY
ncbi:hypothetical protein A3E14_03715 [Candidatus Curtissbacteria bacterium RIFCSPHIGHO2_12_FULL_41_13]|nr:MAG: hypothetical protein A3E14_03715 [Candidatus Curtissbacteria bacterium RIFCSPHIGHO2_12_FULL_41_13]OGE13814.1 MAG: hypothetical protein A3J89_03440 [Candidatus Curtissbacteria bacterium RIFOXYB12_FULL_40_6]